ncbi:D-alanyl-D-alanine carboxypeptidase family protein 1 [Achromobacter xylosoxidans A8]|uniref:D-alanyl-D-alanine carboxypeptidase family protein 1 n=1 Tax=Achromobacter xylosoxidans (strain A8) TaxID=762376 RepID=E3HK77_ACHXA|nr:M15 family metallopeptidase [Achromobacter xylosoxidans]ADP16874.1 D-alanyl-D-alanine carboxypeptidase family protein 1 [Achromobacter xylosoxidans A8]
MLERSYLSNSFTVSDPDARLRQANNLMAFETANGKIRIIPKGTVVRVDAIQRLQTGAKKVALFAHAVREDGEPLGWTSTKNVDGGFINETLDLLKPAAGSGKFGSNAAWSHGAYIGQIDVVEIIDSKMEIERLSIDTVSPYLEMVGEAKSSGVNLTINSGFRSYPEQKMLWDGYVKRLPGFNLAAKPGNSNHQNGIAIDIAVAGADGNEVYEWLKQSAPRFGFVRTVSGEPWHWEYDPGRAQQAVQNGTYKIPSVND